MKNLNTLYGNIAAPVDGADYPYGKPSNSTVTGALDGFPLDEDWLKDNWGALHAVLGAAGIAPDNTNETAIDSQFLDALRVLLGVTGGTSGNLVSIGSGKLSPSSTKDPGQDLRTSASPTWANATIAGKLVSTYLAYLNQALLTTSSPTFATVNTGQGANELYPMNQPLRITDNVNFVDITGSGDLTIGGSISPTTSPTLGTQTLAALSTYTLPRGIYNISFPIAGSASVAIEIYDGSAWEIVVFLDTSSAVGSYGSAVFSDGTNVRIENFLASPYTFSYQKY